MSEISKLDRLTIDYADCHSRLRDAWERLRAYRNQLQVLLEENKKLKDRIKILERPHSHEGFGDL